MIIYRSTFVTINRQRHTIAN